MVYWIHGDQLGSTSLTTNVSGNAVGGTMRYKPFGEPRNGGAMPTDLRFTGQRELGRVGQGMGSLMFYGARAYSPVLGRFVSADTIVPGAGNPQAFNRYAYALNRPLVMRDPTGHWPDWQDISDFAAGFGGALASANMSLAPLPNSREREQIADALFVAPGTDRNSDAYQTGRIVGNVTGILQGGIEMVSGGGMMLGGGACLVLSAGACAPITLVAAGVGVIEAGHGLSVAKKGIDDVTMLMATKNSAGDRYPSVKDPRTGKNIPKPSGKVSIVPPDQRVSWGKEGRAAFIKEWYDRGYGTPEGGWENYDIHHIKPREYGGTNDFSNLVPVEREAHKDFNKYWERYP